VADDAPLSSWPASGTDAAAAVRRLTRSVVADVVVEPFGAYLFSRDEPGAALARGLEAHVFLDTFGDTPEELAAGFAPYDAGSVFLCVIDHRRAVPAGVMRVLLPSPAGFKSLNDIEPVWGIGAEDLCERTGLALDQRRTWDIATLAVAPEYRGGAVQGLVTMGLFQTLTLAALRCGVEWFVAILDMPAFRMVRWRLRMIFAGFEGVGPRPYLGSPASIPAWCNVPNAARHLAATDPDLYDVVVRGVGLEAGLRRVDLDSADRLVVRGVAGAGV
jgi:hypothetical protein